MLGQRRNLNHCRVVEVLLHALFERHVAEIEIVVVEMEAQAAQHAGHFVGQRGFARAGAAGNAQHRGRKGQPGNLRGDLACDSRAHGSCSTFAAILGARRFSSPASRRSTMRPASFTSSWLSGVAPSPAARLVTQEMPSTSIPMCRATIVSGTVDMPTSVAPSVRKARISAGVSKLGPGVARYTPSSSVN